MKKWDWDQQWAHLSFIAPEPVVTRVRQTLKDQSHQRPTHRLTWITSQSVCFSANKVRWLAAGPPPHQIHPVKGSVHITANRDFVDYVINNPVAKDFLNWSRKVAVPDETFFASLNHNPHLRIPGTYKGKEWDLNSRTFAENIWNLFHIVQ